MLQKGTEIKLEVTNDGKLIIDTKANVEPQLKEVSLTVGPYLSRQIVGSYLWGYAIIKIETKSSIDSNERNLVKSTAN